MKADSKTEDLNTVLDALIATEKLLDAEQAIPAAVTRAIARKRAVPHNGVFLEAVGEGEAVDRKKEDIKKWMIREVG